MKALYKAGFKLYIFYIDCFVEVAETPKAAKNMLKYISSRAAARLSKWRGVRVV